MAWGTPGPSSPSRRRQRQNDSVEGSRKIWEPNKLRLFISHTHQHKLEVADQKLALAKLGVHAFVAHEDIEPSLEWQWVIEEALRTCDAAVAWLTPDFHASNWTDQEIGYCLAMDKQVVPVRVGSNPYGFIAKYHGLQAFDSEPFDIATAIVEALAKNSNTATGFLDPAARAFAAAGSFKMACATYKTLTFLPTEGWTEETLRVLAGACQVG